MTLSFEPMTELDAVNEMLVSIGQAPVNSLDVSGIRDVAIAQQTLHTVNRNVQSTGWHFNTDERYELVPDGSSHILVPAATIAIDVCDPNYDMVMRDNSGTMMLWDRTEHTFTITVSPLEVDITWFYAFDELPQYARMYIGLRAARRFQSLIVGSQILHAYTAEDEMAALINLKRQDGRSADSNILRTGNFTDQIFARRANPRTFR